MSELLSIIDADDVEFQVTPANNVYWKFPIEGAWERKEPAKHERLMRPRPFRHIGSRMEVLKLTVEFGLKGSSRGTLQTRIDALLWRMDPDRGLFTLKRTTSNSTERRIDLKRTGYTIDRKALANGGPLVPVTVTAEAPDPVWYDPTAVTPSGQFNGATPVNISCANSNVGTYIKVTIAGPVDTPKMQNADTDYMQLEDSIAAGETLVVDFRPEESTFGAILTLTGGGTEDWTGKRSSDSKWWELPAATTNVTFSAASGTGGITIEFTKYYKVLH